MIPGEVMTDDPQHRAAEALLYRSVETVDPASGAPRRERVPTPLYHAYRERRAEYQAAAAAYAAAHQEAQKTPSGRSTWPLLAATLQLAVKQAKERLLAARAEQVEQAEALLARAAVPASK